MGRKPRVKIPGTVDWITKIMDLPQSVVTLAETIALKKSVVGRKHPVGLLLRDWIVAGAKKEAKRLGLDIGG